jgi:hypothetical protein
LKNTGLCYLTLLKFLSSNMDDLHFSVNRIVFCLVLTVSMSCSNYAYENEIHKPSKQPPAVAQNSSDSFPNTAPRGIELKLDGGTLLVDTSHRGVCRQNVGEVFTRNEGSEKCTISTSKTFYNPKRCEQTSSCTKVEGSGPEPGTGTGTGSGSGPVPVQGSGEDPENSSDAPPIVSAEDKARGYYHATICATLLDYSRWGPLGDEVNLAYPSLEEMDTVICILKGKNIFDLPAPHAAFGSNGESVAPVCFEVEGYLDHGTSPRHDAMKWAEKHLQDDPESHRGAYLLYLAEPGVNFLANAKAGWILGCFRAIPEGAE